MVVYYSPLSVGVVLVGHCGDFFTVLRTIGIFIGGGCYVL